MERCRDAKTKNLISEVTLLPIEEQATVADCILRSLNPPESDIEAQWAEVAKRRLAELRSGHAQAVPEEKVFTEIRKRFKA